MLADDAAGVTLRETVLPSDAVDCPPPPLRAYTFPEATSFRDPRHRTMESALTSAPHCLLKETPLLIFNLSFGEIAAPSNTDWSRKFQNCEPPPVLAEMRWRWMCGVDREKTFG